MASEPKMEEREFFSVYDGTKGRPDNTMYLDIQERIEAEKIRARLEGREPQLDDFGKLGPATGTQVVPKAWQVDNSLFANPSVGSGFTEPREVDPVVTAEVEVEPAAGDVDLSQAAQYARERQSEDKALTSTTDASSKSAPDATKRTPVK